MIQFPPLPPLLRDAALLPLRFLPSGLQSGVLAVAVNRKIPTILRYIFRTAYFFPVLTSLASVSIVWVYL